jgi:hypothetical protein
MALLASVKERRGGGGRLAMRRGVEERKGHIQQFNSILFLILECSKCLHKGTEGVEMGCAYIADTLKIWEAGLMLRCVL